MIAPASNHTPESLLQLTPHHLLESHPNPVGTTFGTFPEASYFPSERRHPIILPFPPLEEIPLEAIFSKRSLECTGKTSRHGRTRTPPHGTRRERKRRSSLPHPSLLATNHSNTRIPLKGTASYPAEADCSTQVTVAPKRGLDRKDKA